MNPRVKGPSKYQNDLRGVRFGKLTVVAYEGKTPLRNSLWTCICDCGGTRLGVAYQSLMSGLTKACYLCGSPVRRKPPKPQPTEPPTPEW